MTIFFQEAEREIFPGVLASQNLNPSAITDQKLILGKTMFFSTGSPMASFHVERKWCVIKGEMRVGVLGLRIGNISPTVYSFGFPNIKICLQSNTQSLIDSISLIWLVVWPLTEAPKYLGKIFTSQNHSFRHFNIRPRNQPWLYSQTITDLS